MPDYPIINVHPKRPTEPEKELRHTYAESDKPIAKRLVRPAIRFMHQETAGGMVLLAAAIVALILANSPLAEHYQHFIHSKIMVGFKEGFNITLSVEHWVNDLLMAVFFFVAGMEIKRDLTHGDLSDPKRAMLPIFGALGGMMVPASIFVIANLGHSTINGWGVPMATDIAFAVGVLAIVGDRAPAGLRSFLLTLAIVDDIGGIIVIALFYGSSINVPALLGAALVVLFIVAMKHNNVQFLPFYIIMGGLLWVLVFQSGIHATIAGVILGLLTPAVPFQKPAAVTGTIMAKVAAFQERDPYDPVTSEDEQGQLAHVAHLAHGGVSPLQRLEHALHPWSSFVVLPLFALVNAGVPLDSEAFGALISVPAAYGIFLGLVVGKPIGVLLFSFIAVKFLKAKLPHGVGALELAGTGLLAGVGFTVAIFIAGLAFPDPQIVVDAKVAILLASLLSGVVGYVFLVSRKTT